MCGAKLREPTRHDCGHAALHSGLQLQDQAVVGPSTYRMGEQSKQWLGKLQELLHRPSLSRMASE